MALDDKIYDLRREKLKQIEALGQPTYRSKYEFTHTAEQILTAYSPKTAEELDQARVDAARSGTHHGDPPDGEGRVRAHPAGRQETADLR